MSRSSFVRNVAMLGGGTGAAQLFLVLATPLITRLYDPEVIGAFGVFLSAATFGIIVAPLGYHVAIVSAESDGDAAALTVGSIAVVMVTALMCGAGTFVLIDQSLLGFDSLPLYVAALAGLTVALGAGFETIRFWFVRTETFRAISWVTAWQGGGRAFAPVALGLAGMGLPGLILGDLVGRCLGVIKIARLGYPQLRDGVQSPRRRTVLRVLSAYRRYPQYQLPSRIANTAAQLLPVPLVMDLYGPQVAGLFVMVDRVFGIPTTFVGRAVGDVLHARLTTQHRAGSARVLQEFLRVGAALLVASLAGALVVVLFGEELFAFALGAEWRTAGRIAVLIAPWAAARFVVSPLSRVVFVFDALRTKFIYDVVALAAVVGTFWLARTRGMEAMEAFRLLSGLNVAAYGLYAVLLVIIVRSGVARRPANPPMSRNR